MKKQAAKLKQMQKIVEFRENEQLLMRSIVFDAQNLRERATQIQNHTKNSRDDALADWQACRASGHIDIGLEPAMGKQLIEQEQQLQQSDNLLAIAEKRLKQAQDNWHQCDLSLRTSKKAEKKARRKFRQKTEENSAAETSDLFNFRRPTLW